MRLGAYFAAAAVLAGLGASGAPPLQPKFDSAGNFVHDPNVAMTVVSIAPAGIVLECRQPSASGAVQVWRERYVIRGGKLVLSAIITQRDVPAQPEHSEWQEMAVDEKAPPATVAAKVAGTDLRGTMVDPRWSSYPDYLGKVVQTIQTTWDHERITKKLNARTGNRVSVKFVLDAQGVISRVESVEFSPGMSDAAVRACVTAITGPSPYPPWTDEMIAALGSEQTLNLAFYYP